MGHAEATNGHPPHDCIKHHFPQVTKHINIKYHYTYDCINKGIVKVLPVSTKDTIVDLLTKPLPCNQHQRLTSRLGISNC